MSDSSNANVPHESAVANQTLAGHEPLIVTKEQRKDEGEGSDVILKAPSERKLSRLKSMTSPPLPTMSSSYENLPVEMKASSSASLLVEKRLAVKGLHNTGYVLSRGSQTPPASTTLHFSRTPPTASSSSSCLSTPSPDHFF